MTRTKDKKDKPLKITNFSIKKLFGFMNVDIPIVDNRIIITGFNGTGKTTILTMLFYVMSGNWIKLLEFIFDEISLEINNKEYKIVKEKLKPKFNDLEKQISFFRRRTPLSPKQIMTIVESFLLNDFDETKLIGIAKELEMPARYLYDLKEELFSNDLFEKDDSIISIKKIMQDFNKICFLPTYRRIEKDLKDVEEFSNDEHDDRLRRSNLRRSLKVSSSLINFGMEDVSVRINKSLTTLKEISSKKFKDLASNHFKEMLNPDDNNSVNLLEELKKYTKEDITKILNRIEEVDLSLREKEALLNSILKLKDNQTAEINEKMSAKFFLKIAEIDTELTQKEKPIRDLAKICTDYLSDSGKIVHYDNQNYVFEILSKAKQKVDLKSLSSGEKQILSIFSDIYLEDYKNFAFIIDEPELSLSIEWQKKFLSDIWNTGKCSFLMAVTHSPFVFENDLDEYAQDIENLCSV